MELSKPVKIGIAIMAIIIIMLVVYYVFGGKTEDAAANPDEIAKLGPVSEGRDPYYSKETYERIKAGDFGKWKDFDSQEHANEFWGGMTAVFGEGFDKDEDVNKKPSSYIIAWFKGMDLFMNANAVSYFKADIKKYIGSSVAMKHWDVKPGTFVKA